MSEMKEFSGYECPKCEYKMRIDTKYSPPTEESEECLLRMCAYCGYAWRERCADYEEK